MLVYQRVKHHLPIFLVWLLNWVYPLFSDKLPYIYIYNWLRTMIITITMIMNQSLSGMIEGDTSKMGQNEPLEKSHGMLEKSQFSSTIFPLKHIWKTSDSWYGDFPAAMMTSQRVNIPKRWIPWRFRFRQVTAGHWFQDFSRISFCQKY